MHDDVVDVAPSRRRPVIIVRTDEDTTGFSTFTIAQRSVRLLIEIGVLTTATVKLSNGREEARVDWPRTDASLEAFLDMLEWQVTQALFGWSEWAQWWRDFNNYGNMFNQQSLPRFSPPERGAVRLAVRTLVFVMALPPECVITPQKEFGPSPPILLPGNLWRVACYILKHGGGDFKTAIEQLAKVIGTHGPITRPTFPPLHRVWATIPDLEIEADWRIEQEAPFFAGDMQTSPPDLGKPSGAANGAS
jgi:hypothetical protein